MNLLAYRDQEIFKSLSQKILPILEKHKQKLGRRIRIMEVCGTHTVAFSKTGVREMLSDFVELVSGPGCPVCVTSSTDLDQMITYANQKDTIVVTFGDMMKVPGSFSTLYEQRAEGGDIRIVYSASQAVEIAKENLQKQVVFLGVGFETTAPGIALSIKKADQEKVDNYFVYSAHKLTPPALGSLLENQDHQIDGFLLPGHVSVIIGRKGWRLLEELNQPAVIGGFEPIDLLMSISILVDEIGEQRRKVVNNYRRLVKEEGNLVAQAVLKEVFEVAPVEWRGFGELPESGLNIHASYHTFDAKRMIPLEIVNRKKITGCRCGQIVKGIESPWQCPLFAKICTPQNPIGPCMVSSEGTCSTYYQFERKVGN